LFSKVLASSSQQSNLFQFLQEIHRAMHLQIYFIFIQFKILLLGLVMNTSALAAVYVDDILNSVNYFFFYLFIIYSTATFVLPIPLEISKNEGIG